MVRPYDFGFNEETGKDNEFQQKLRPSAIEINKKTSGYKIRNITNVGHLDETDSFLEGTGSMVIDHAGEIVYAARSKRCSDEQFDNFIRLCFYEESILFDTKSSTGHPVYHANVMMGIGEKFAVVCLDCISNEDDKARVYKPLNQFFDVIEISMDQMEKHCGGSARCMMAEIFSEKTV